MNACWRSSNRNNLVANLQAENRTIISLQEENRQLKFSLEEMESALHLIMQKHRSLIVDFSRADKLLNLIQSVEKQVDFGLIHIPAVKNFLTIGEIISNLNVENVFYLM